MVSIHMTCTIGVPFVRFPTRLWAARMADSGCRDCWHPDNPKRLYNSLFAAVGHDTRLWTGIQARQLSPYTTYTDTQVLESFILKCLVLACYTPPPLSRFTSHCWQG